MTLPNIRRPRSLRRKHLVLRIIVHLLPLALILSNLAFYVPIFKANRQSTSRHDLYFLKFTLSASAATLQPTTSLSSAAGSILQELSLHIPTWYTVSLYTSCQGGNWNAAAHNEAGAYDERRPTYCSPPKAAYWFNPATIAGLDTSALRGDEKYNLAIKRYRRYARALFAMYITSLSTTSASAFAYLVHLLLPHDWRPIEVPISKTVALLSKIALACQVCISIATIAMTAMVYFSLQAVINAKLGRLGVTAAVGSKLLTFSVMPCLLGLCVVVIRVWISHCCPRRGEPTYWPGRRRDLYLMWRGEKGLPQRRDSFAGSWTKSDDYITSGSMSGEDEYLDVDHQEDEEKGRVLDRRKPDIATWKSHGIRIIKKKSSIASIKPLMSLRNATTPDRKRLRVPVPSRRSTSSSADDQSSIMTASSSSSSSTCGSAYRDERSPKKQARGVSPALSSGASSATVVVYDENEEEENEYDRDNNAGGDKWAWEDDDTIEEEKEEEEDEEEGAREQEVEDKEAEAEVQQGRTTDDRIEEGGGDEADAIDKIKR